MSKEFECAECGVHVFDASDTSPGVLCLECTFMPDDVLRRLGSHPIRPTLRGSPDSLLIEEICRRIMKQESGLCTYCDQSHETPPCKFPERHAGKEPHIFAALFDEVRARFSWSDPNSRLPDTLLNATMDLMTRGLAGRITCTCKAPGGYPHEPDCPAWEKPAHTADCICMSCRTGRVSSANPHGWADE